VDEKEATYYDKNNVSPIIITDYFNTKVHHKNNTPNRGKERNN